MPTIVFWNVNAQPRAQLVAAIAHDTGADIVALAEQGDTATDMLLALNAHQTEYSYAPGIGNTKIELYVRFPEELAAPIYETDRLTVRRVVLPGIEEFLLAVVHFPSKYAWSAASQAAECFVLADDLRRVEAECGHERTALVGDLNMNPFEDGLVDAVGLHAVMTRAIAGKGRRTVQGRTYPFFYNPMWGTLGDTSGGPPGSFYHYRAEHRVYFWNAFDQVLIRPALLHRFPAAHLQVLTEAGGRTLVNTEGEPDPVEASDHLPVVFRID